MCSFHFFQAEQAARLKAEKVRLALEKIKEANIKKVGATWYGHKMRKLLYMHIFMGQYYIHGLFCIDSL